VFGPHGPTPVKPHGPAPPPKPAPKPPPAGPAIQFQSDNFAQLQAQLAQQYRVPADTAQRAAAAIAGALGGRDGKLHSTVYLSGPTVTTLRVRRVDDGTGAQLDLAGGAFAVTPLAANLTTQLCATPQGQMDDSSFGASFERVFHDDDLIRQFAQVMSKDVNFTHDISPGSEFSAVYEQTLDGDGNAVGGRQLVFASLYLGAIHDSENFQGQAQARDVPARNLSRYRFTPPAGQPTWYDGDGGTTVGGLMRTPLDVVRITSPFGMRFHPLDHIFKVHEGVDFGCPIGTTVYAAADGVVAYAGPASGYGNLLEITHTPHIQTRYGHVSAFTCKQGDVVKQSQPVALSGNLGKSTGPHLHFEVRVDNVPVDPLTFTGLGSTTQKLSGAGLDAFRKRRAEIDAAANSCALPTG
jgi:murein DD-endopeptidase MepM/ murein hydrolase activator NlpD